MLIKLAGEYHARDLENRPGILIKRNEVSFKKFSIRGQALTHLEPDGAYRGEDHIRLVSGSHIIMCVAEGENATDRLAEEVAYRLMHYISCIKEDLKFTEIEVSGISTSERFRESGAKNFVARVGIPWTVTENWTLVPISPILKKVRIITPDIV
jgi:hypothetical protein